MANLIGIIGPSGSGKSTSCESLNPDETFIINVVGKPLPWKGSKSIYNSTKKNYLETKSAPTIEAMLKEINDKALHIKNVIIDDTQYVMSIEYMNRAKENGYNKFSEIAGNMFKIFNAATSFRPDLNIVYLSHSEPVMDNGAISEYKMKTIGQMVDNTINLEGLFTTCLYTRVTQNDKGENIYEFITNRLDKFPAKSPKGMFETNTIPNDLSLVFKAMEEYYS